MHGDWTRFWESMDAEAEREEWLREMGVWDESIVDKDEEE